ncbi:hypothetical protein DUNSADRAFT_14734 [Dunaliella salina]|uniref:Uncharacterized protein n=1 Tax=Dunaliella salina TaxID=3046 RepID=A0ABQ7H2E7_DUNSA|nr:hypothetical protein DUNSADRAFT_14734 [Dunaliella salina]|eukprot:KAF5841027.1 hypothetical protein DUNSADRAFT_14734 [Dunaliella salina]
MVDVFVMIGDGCSGMPFRLRSSPGTPRPTTWIAIWPMGALLLRNTKDDHVYYIVADELKQIDLSSDQVVAQLFKDGQWEAAAAPLYFGQDTPMKHVKITGPQFHYLITLLSEAPSPP